MSHVCGGRQRLARLGAALLVAGMLVACADDSDGDSTSSPPSPEPASATLDPAALDGMSYASTSVEGRELAPGSAIEMTFEDGTMSVWAGCNSLFGSLEVDGATLAWAEEPAATRMMCDPELGEQDEWLAGLLTSGVTATAEGDALTLEGDGVTIELASAPTDDLVGLLGRTWTVIGTVSDGAVSRLPVNTRRPRLDVGPEGLSRLFTGCRSGRTTVSVVATTLAFANTTVQRGRCTGPARQTERAVLALLDGPAHNVDLHEHLLVVTRDGRGLFLEVR
ncbi:META domain-containing protein [Nocardioides astragali]|uniref:META domain-containing protein n=1 Tax=Nocardioides astragali TaxID=1776736 RepID=A0ABW2N742_9ACTN|nr:META domain-containing protein [Nocardioides astragali]